MIFTGLWNSKIDNIVHFFAVGCTLVYWFMLWKKINLNWLLVANVIYALLVLILLKGMTKDL